eukprot:scaffold182_cov350-Prasinococcus_capsulatus_cf.AAC.16
MRGLAAASATAALALALALALAFTAVGRGLVGVRRQHVGATAAGAHVRRAQSEELCSALLHRTLQRCGVLPRMLRLHGHAQARSVHDAVGLCDAHATPITALVYAHPRAAPRHPPPHAEGMGGLSPEPGPHTRRLHHLCTPMPASQPASQPSIHPSHASIRPFVLASEDGRAIVIAAGHGRATAVSATPTSVDRGSPTQDAAADADDAGLGRHLASPPLARARGHVPRPRWCHTCPAHRRILAARMPRRVAPARTRRALGQRRLRARGVTHDDRGVAGSAGSR